MGTPPIRGIGRGWILRSWSGRSSIPQRIARFRQIGVRTNAAAKAAAATMNSEYMADASVEKVSRMESNYFNQTARANLDAGYLHVTSGQRHVKYQKAEGWKGLSLVTSGFGPQCSGLERRVPAPVRRVLRMQFLLI